MIMDWTTRPVCLGRWQLLSRVQVLSIGRDSRRLYAELKEFWQRAVQRLLRTLNDRDWMMSKL